jgi:hypothetical protein
MPKVSCVTVAASLAAAAGGMALEGGDPDAQVIDRLAEVGQRSGVAGDVVFDALKGSPILSTPSRNLAT